MGTFDEAFKSRIQLSLYYPNLTEADRRKIWRNFIAMLDKAGEDIDIHDLQDHIKDLARFELNGRQIRNAITNSRQLAQYNEEKLNYSHLQVVLATTAEFDKYLQQTHGHTDDQWALAEKLRVTDLSE